MTVRKGKNRRRPGSVWSRMPKPAEMVASCGRVVRRALPAAAVIAAVGAAGGGVWGGYHWLTHSQRFAITTIEIDGATHLDADEIRAQLPVRVGDNVFVGLAGVARAVHANPWVASVDVHRQLPHTIAIDVHEHVATAVVDFGELYLVNASGHPFKRAALETGEGDNLPIITGLDRGAYAANPDAVATNVRGAVAAFDSWRIAGRPAIGEVHLDAHGAVTLHTYDQAVAIQLGPLGPGLGARMHTFDAAWQSLSDAERTRARAIHLDARPDHVTVAFAKD